MSDGSTVLVVDDESELADLYATWLRRNYTVQTAYGGEAALDALGPDVDVALIDRLMPRMSGTELLTHISSSGFDCRVAIVTAVEPDFDIIEMGFDEYLVKPIRREEVTDVVDSLIARSQYDEQLQELFALASKRAALQAEKSKQELESSDAYAELTAEFERLQAEIEQTAGRLQPRDFEVEMRQLTEATAND